MKWLAVAAAVVAAALLLLWYEVRNPGTPRASASTQVAPAAPAKPAGPIKNPRLDAPMDVVELDDDAPLPPGVRPAGTMAPEDDPGPIRKFSEPFWERVDEVYSRKLLGFAADCYEGGKDRKQKVKLAFRFNISGGNVTVRDVRMVESTMNDPKLEACMLKAVSNATWLDKNMPDWSSLPEEEETLLVRISTLKRFGPPSD
ncbi:MAG TPA: hypothetical protein VM261_27550 [Kofleriaceae bacterium]|nr:hypothetical protein [Kofleriaceae bacterium]